VEFREQKQASSASSCLLDALSEDACSRSHLYVVVASSLKRLRSSTAVRLTPTVAAALLHLHFAAANGTVAALGSSSCCNSCCKMQQPRIPEETASQLLRLSPTPSTPSLPRRPAAASSAPAAYHPARPPSPTAAASLDLCWRGATEVAASRDCGERCGGGSGDREGRGRSVATRWLWARASASAPRLLLRRPLSARCR
jgi:hypothetical protein